LKLPKGFLASGVRSGVRRRRPDLALVVAQQSATAAALFTRNRFPAAPVSLSRAALRRSGGRVRAAVINSGCANAITGRAGWLAAARVRRRAAELLACPESEIFLASTGVIGVVLPDARVRGALPDAIARLAPGGLDAASQAILTTDAGPKVAAATFRVGGRRGRVVGFAKGAGMIHPNLATMLAFVMTDAAATNGYLQTAVRRAADRSFNAISVDGDTSTNDTVLLMASGCLRNPVLAGGSESADFERALVSVCEELAWRIVRDGEGATRVMEVTVSGAATTREAKLAAHAVATSPLVKTALHGGDPNWGRILAAVGRSGARFSPQRTSLSVGRLLLVSAGEPGTYRERDAARAFARERVPIAVDLGAGSATARVLASDLGHDYVSLNADYRS
jgi:glutamate N-acetyltransferase/amino-acid N-acetyltransferase